MSALSHRRGWQICVVVCAALAAASARAEGPVEAKAKAATGKVVTQVRHAQPTLSPAPGPAPPPLLGDRKAISDRKTVATKQLTPPTAVVFLVAGKGYQEFEYDIEIIDMFVSLHRVEPDGASLPRRMAPASDASLHRDKPSGGEMLIVAPDGQQFCQNDGVRRPCEFHPQKNGSYRLRVENGGPAASRFIMQFTPALGALPEVKRALKN